MNEITIRPTELDDLSILYEFEQGIVNAERPFDPTLKVGNINYYDLKVLITSSDVEVLVALIENEIVGSGYIQIKQSKSYLSHQQYGYLGFMFVKPNHRGKGVIQKITNSLLVWAKSKDINEVRLEVYEDNLTAVRAYEKAGFKKHMVEMRRSI